jgi:hypothetical protein
MRSYWTYILATTLPGVAPVRQLVPAELWILGTSPSMTCVVPCFSGTLSPGGAKGGDIFLGLMM